LTWFRKQPQVAWFDGPGDSGEIQIAVHLLLESWLRDRWDSPGVPTFPLTF
jgi:hypothetical protein